MCNKYISSRACPGYDELRRVEGPPDQDHVESEGPLPQEVIDQCQMQKPLSLPMS